MTYPNALHQEERSLIPIDPDEAQREQRLRELGLRLEPDETFDAFASHIAEKSVGITGHPPIAAFVNLITDKQNIAGLYIDPRDPEPTTLAGVVDLRTIPLREGALDFGFCPHVVVRRKALVLDDVCEYPRFAGNPIVDQLGIRTYVGAPLIDDITGLALGTVCVVDREPRMWGQEGLKYIKDQAAVLMDEIRRRPHLPDTTNF